MLVIRESSLCTLNVTGYRVMVTDSVIAEIVLTHGTEPLIAKGYMMRLVITIGEYSYVTVGCLWVRLCDTVFTVNMI